jgi:RNA ligase (TIGR02306 family)
MATFKTEVVRLSIEEHPNADALEIARVGDYTSIVQKGQYETGDLGVYIPEQAILPGWLISDLGLEGRLAGKDKNRVKAIKLRGVLSQGLIYPVDGPGDDYRPDWPMDSGPGSTVLTFLQNNEGQYIGVGEGSDVTEFLGITKYEPVIPSHMNGQVFNASGYTPKYDIENIKRYPDVFVEGEDVVITEKLHGTWACFGYHPDVAHPIISSKGLSGKGLAFKWKFPENENNLYVRTFRGLTFRDVNNDRLFPDQLGTTIVDRVHRGLKLPPNEAVYVMGEIFGHGVQDLGYGVGKSTGKGFRVFDIYVGSPGSGSYVGADELIPLLANIGLEHVPVLHLGPWNVRLIDELTSGKTTLDADHIREGIVIKPAEERRDADIGRVILKSVSEQYLLRKGDTTEYA